MKRDAIEVKKRRADQLVDSYGALQLVSSFEEAIDHLNRIWDLDPIDFQILRPKRSVLFSKIIRKTTSYVGGTGKSFVGGRAAKEAFKAVKTTGGVAEKASVALEQAKSAKIAVSTVAKAGLNIVKQNKLAAAGVGTVTAATSIGLGFTLKRDLKAFNDKCYNHKLEMLSDSGDQS